MKTNGLLYELRRYKLEDGTYNGVVLDGNYDTERAYYDKLFHLYDDYFKQLIERIDNLLLEKDLSVIKIFINAKIQELNEVDEELKEYYI